MAISICLSFNYKLLELSISIFKLFSKLSLSYLLSPTSLSLKLIFQTKPRILRLGVFCVCGQQGTVQTNVYTLTDWSLSLNREALFFMDLTDEWALTLSRESRQYSRIVVSRAMS